MRLRPTDLITVYLKEPQQGQDDEGNIITGGWSEPVALQMNVQSAGGAVNAQIWGKDLKYIKSCKYQGDEINEGKQEGWGLCVNVSKDAEPDYLINSIQTFSTHKNVTLDQRRKDSVANG
ncbi:hypothetical protein DA799_14095 [Lactiplantibacillus plantarum]|uniref:hypothetical protein n=1 Tax=Lactiplantibacillus plantarum TaxID=1590 RepID=UPI00097832AE|nr:hypothetical protein [Lactiplantibacillus plantarum]MBO2713215.1 hypothetical protein [Lactiplantibacillus plantarum]PKX67088.1 hypothetical protein CUB88_01810 [Lactiplantibacillus plantarum]PTM28941.1 hypothetical protein DA799_14095 [Lactiplantibacillus plantarum]